LKFLIKANTYVNNGCGKIMAVASAIAKFPN
jgi:hypothetical protein